jgi:endonuclease YncB( thermonuclease family)
MLLLLASVAYADAVKPADIYVVDGDTIEALGKRIRLVGFDAPAAMPAAAWSKPSRPGPHRACGR